MGANAPVLESNMDSQMADKVRRALTANKKIASTPQHSLQSNLNEPLVSSHYSQFTSAHKGVFTIEAKNST